VIDVALTGDGARTADVAVVIDVLRATSTATQALAAGYRRVLCVGSIERAAQLRTGDRVLAGEQRCVKPPGFDQGNSPREALDRRGEELVLATTNGAPTMSLREHARRQYCWPVFSTSMQWSSTYFSARIGALRICKSSARRPTER